MSERAEEQHQRFLAALPPEEQLAVVVREVCPGHTVERVVPLPGGIASAVHRVDVQGGRSFVVRRFNAQLPWHSDERVAREARMLTALEPTPVLAPRVLFADVDGAATGCPMLVLSLLPGCGIDPPGDGAWARELATSLAHIHEQASPFDAEPWLTFWATAEALPHEIATHPRSSEIWEAIVPVRDELASDRQSLAHHDFHPGNTLWLDGAVSGVVDWPLAGRGYPAYDAVYCAFDTTLSKGLDAGERFLRTYEAIAGREMHPGWRLVVATRALDELDDWIGCYLGLGTQMTLDDLHRRFDEWVDRALDLVR